MFAELTQETIAPKDAGVVDRALAGAHPNVIHQHCGGYRLNQLGVGPALSLEEAEDHISASNTPTAPALVPTAEIGSIQSDLPLELAALRISKVEQGFAQTLLDPAHHFDLQTQVSGQPLGWSQVVEPLQDCDLDTQSRQSLRQTAVATLDVAASRAHHP